VSLVVLDTDAASALLRRRDVARLTNLLAGHVVAVTFVTVGEMTKWTLVRHWGPDRRDTLQRFLDGFVTLPYDRLVAARWGQIQATAQLRGRPRPVNDSWVAACCLARDLPLITFNIKDYIDFAEHDGLTLLQ
jgi:predicted nucleic acid-binding protein